MKKTKLMAAVVLAAGLASCGSKAPKAVLKTDVDSLSYAIGMARTQGLEQYLLQSGVDSAQMKEFLKGFSVGTTQSTAYSMGVSIGNRVATQIAGFSENIFADKNKLNKSNVIAGFLAGVLKDTLVMDVNEASKFMQENIDRIKKAENEKLYAANREAGEKFLKENAVKEDVVTLPSGLQYKVIIEGKGAKPTADQTVKVHYKGTLIDGTVFDSSYERKDPAVFGVDKVIKGWTEALQLMPVGSKWEIYIPYNLAYGDRSAGQDIKPYSALKFEVELLSIEK